MKCTIQKKQRKYDFTLCLMMSLSPQDLIKLYFKQLTDGCDCGECQNDACKTSVCFQYHFENPNQAAVEAIHFSLRHPANDKLCKRIIYSELKDETKQNIAEFNNYMGKMIHREEFDVENARNAIQKIFQDHLGFSYILMNNGNHLNPHINDIHLDESIVTEIPKALQHFREKMKLDELNILFRNLASKIILNDPPNCVHHIRSIILLFSMDIYFEKYDDFVFNLLPILKHLLNFPPWSNKFFISILSLYPTLLSNLLEKSKQIIINFLTKCVNEENGKKKIDFYQENSILYIALRFIDILHDSNLSSRNPLPVTCFYIKEIEPFIKLKKEYERIQNKMKSVLSSPCAPFRMRYLLLLLYLNAKQNCAKASRTKLKIVAHRDNIASDVMNIINMSPIELLESPIQVSFYKEPGIDFGSLTREFFYIAASTIFSPNYSLFRIVNDNFYWFSDSCFKEDIHYYKALGTFVALAIIHGIALPVRFPLLLYKKLLNKTISIADANELDPSIGDLLASLIDFRYKGGNVEDLNLTFSTAIEQYGESIVIPFFEGGHSTPVNNDNLDRYISQYIDFKLIYSVQEQFRLFQEGFMNLCSNPLFSCFTPEEFDILVSGEKEINWDELKIHAIYEGYSSQSSTIQMFWDCFNDLDIDTKFKILRFVTGSTCVPIGGFKDLIFKITRAKESIRFHTCYNTLEMPEYTSIESMKDGILFSLSKTIL